MTKKLFDDVPDARRIIMRSIKGSETKPEKFLRSIIHKAGYRFRKNVKSLPGKPDIVFSTRKKIIWVNGCFWHFHQTCRPEATLPKIRNEYWKLKFLRTQQRDRENIQQLNRANWSVLVIWECELKEPIKVYNEIICFLGPAKTR